MKRCRPARLTKDGRTSDYKFFHYQSTREIPLPNRRYDLLQIFLQVIRIMLNEIKNCPLFLFRIIMEVLVRRRTGALMETVMPLICACPHLRQPVENRFAVVLIVITDQKTGRLQTMRHLGKRAFSMPQLLRQLGSIQIRMIMYCLQQMNLPRGHLCPAPVIPAFLIDNIAVVAQLNHGLIHPLDKIIHAITFAAF